MSPEHPLPEGGGDPIATLAVGLAADHAAEKAKPPETAEEPEPELDGGMNTDAMEAAVDEAVIMPATLVGDVRDTIIRLFKQFPKPWGKMNTGEQHDVAASAEHMAKMLAGKGMRALASKGVENIEALLKKASDDGSKFTLTLEITGATPDTAMRIHRMMKQRVLLIDADTQAFMGERGPADIPKEEPELAFDAGNDDDGKPPVEVVPIHGVYDPNEEAWLEQDEELWTAKPAEAGRWDAERAAELAEEHGAEVKDIGPAA